MSIDFSVTNALLPIASDCGQQETDKSNKFTKVFATTGLTKGWDTNLKSHPMKN